MAVKNDVRLGKNVKLYHPRLVNLYVCSIGDDCVIGSFVEIRKGVKIGKRVKIQAGAFIPEGVTVSDEVFIGPHVVFTNDPFPRSTNIDGRLKSPSDWKEIPTYVKKRASIGANATVLCGITIGEGAMVGAGSVVLEDVQPHTVVGGNPARKIRKVRKKE